MPARVQYYRAHVEPLPDIPAPSSPHARIERLQADLQAARRSCDRWELRARNLETERERILDERIAKVKRQMEDWYSESLVRQQKRMEVEQQAQMQQLERETQRGLDLRDEQFAGLQQRHERVVARLDASDREVRRLRRRLEDAQEEHMDQGRRQAHFLIASRPSESPGRS